MNREELDKIFESEEIIIQWEGDNVFQGLIIINKYISGNNTIIISAKKDIIYSVDINKIILSGLTEEDAIKLRKLNWMEDSGHLACFV